MSDETRAWDTALDLLVYGPLGLAVAAREELPGIVRGLADRGRRELGRQRAGAEQRLGHTRAVGQFAVNYGAPRLREKVRSRLGSAAAPGSPGRVPAAPDGRSDGDGHHGSDPANGAVRTARSGGSRGAPPARRGATRPAPGALDGDVPAVESLAIPDYDELSASQVVQRLAGLTPAELDAVRRYESAQRARQTVLGRIAQLAP